MVPEAFHDYFVASTGAGAALVGLLFVAVSIAPERTVMSGAPVERQAVATSAYTALLNAFFLSLVALLPQTNLGWAALVLSLIGLAPFHNFRDGIFLKEKSSIRQMVCALNDVRV